MSRSVGFEGIGRGPLVTFLSALVKGTDENKLVKISANRTVALAGDGEDFFGIVRTIDDFDKAAGVQIDGIVENYPAVSGGGSIPTIGKCCIQAHTGSASVQLLAAAAGHTVYDVIEADDTLDVVTFRLG
jgi:hypothetical protein